MPLGACINNGRCTPAQISSIWKASKRYQRHEAMQRTTIEIYIFNFRTSFCCDIWTSHTTDSECFDFWNRTAPISVIKSSRTTLKMRMKVSLKDWYNYNNIYDDTPDDTNHRKYYFLTFRNRSRTQYLVNMETKCNNTGNLKVQHVTRIRV